MPLVPLGRPNVGVADQGHVLHVLDAHDAEQFAVFFPAPEADAAVDLVAKFLPRHVGLVPAVGRDDAIGRLQRHR